jgi:hypothetical protein
MIGQAKRRREAQDARARGRASLRAADAFGRRTVPLHPPAAALCAVRRGRAPRCALRASALLARHAPRCSAATSLFALLTTTSRSPVSFTASPLGCSAQTDAAPPAPAQRHCALATALLTRVIGRVAPLELGPPPTAAPPHAREHSSLRLSRAHHAPVRRTARLGRLCASTLIGAAQLSLHRAPHDPTTLTRRSCLTSRPSTRRRLKPLHLISALSPLSASLTPSLPAPVHHFDASAVPRSPAISRGPSPHPLWCTRARRCASSDSTVLAKAAPPRWPRQRQACCTRATTTRASIRSSCVRSTTSPQRMPARSPLSAAPSLRC